MSATLSLLGLLLLAVPASAQPRAHSFTMGRLQVTGGNQIRGVESGVLLERGSSACRAPASCPAPFSASLGSEVRLALDLIDCLPARPAPTFECEVRIEGEKPVPFRFSGLQGAVNLPLPARTGIYGAEVQCTLDGEEGEVLATTLYVTYAAPREVVNPPEEDWYRQACSWGAGLTADDSETKALETLLLGIYNYGERHWRYGYCLYEGNRCVLDKLSLPQASSSLTCFDDAQVCKCNWETMVRPGSPCNFSDCVGLSAILHYMSATLGVGGLESEIARGHHRQGFLTFGSARAFDPASRGNFLCGYRDLPCAYLFNLHGLRLRDGLYFDPTFRRVYQDLDEQLFADSVLAWPEDGQEVILEHQGGCYVGDGYGNFEVYRERPGAIGTCPQTAATSEVRRASRRPPIPMAVDPGEPPARLSAPSFDLENQDLRIAIAVKEPGDFILDARLFCGTETVAYSGGRADLGQGTQVQTLRFAPEAISRRKTKGSCRITVELHRSDPLELADTLTFNVDLPP